MAQRTVSLMTANDADSVLLYNRVLSYAKSDRIDSLGSRYFGADNPIPYLGDDIDLRDSDVPVALGSNFSGYYCATGVAELLANRGDERMHLVHFTDANRNDLTEILLSTGVYDGFSIYGTRHRGRTEPHSFVLQGEGGQHIRGIESEYLPMSGDVPNKRLHVVTDVSVLKEPVTESAGDKSLVALLMSMLQLPTKQRRVTAISVYGLDQAYANSNNSLEIGIRAYHKIVQKLLKKAEKK